MEKQLTTPDQEQQNKRTFLHLLANTLFVSVIDFTVWFAITFYVYLETKSVFATGMIAGLYLIFIAATGVWFGSLVDHHKKKTMMQLSNYVTLALYSIALLIYLLVPHEEFKDVGSVWLWLFVITLMIGVIVGNIRTIVLPTTVTLLISADKRDKANGMVGTATGVSFLVTSVISGVLVGGTGTPTMLYVLILALVIILAGIAHLWFVKVPETKIVHADDAPRKVDLKGTFGIVRKVPGLLPLILFSTFNNFLGGVFMALMDAYGLSLVSVQMWGFLWGAVSTAMIVGGLMIAKTGLGSNPVKTMLLGNVITWTLTLLFPLQASIVFLAVAMLFYMALIPYIEASEQTILQRVVPYHRQGRVFGFAQSVEQAASPLTAFLIGPITQFAFIPFMTTGAGVGLIGGWFGVGADRGIALVFIITAIIGLIATLLALCSKYYRQLSHQYRTTPASSPEEAMALTPGEAAQSGLKP